MEIVRNYGYIYEGSPDWNRSLSSNENIFSTGYALGIMVPQLSYPQIPGNVGNPWTYDYPVLMWDTKMSIRQLFDSDQSCLDMLKEIGDEMLKHGCRAISGNCGYFANFQRDLAEYLPVPVAMSSLLQINWIKAMLKSDQKIAVICANKSSLSKDTLYNVGVEDPDICVIGDMVDFTQFGEACRTVPGMHPYNPQIFGEELCEEVLKLTNNYNVGAVLLECSDLPPFSHMVARATNLPVYDFITLHNWVVSGVIRKPFTGFF